jgi:hypothetical protein
VSQGKKLLRIIKIILDLIYGALVIACFFLALWLLFSPLILKLGDIVTTASIPIAIGAGDGPQFEVKVSGTAEKEIRSAFVNEAQGVLRLETENWYFIFISNFAKLLTAIGLAYVFYLLRSVIQAFIQGDIFTVKNSVRLRRLGYTVLLLGFFRPAVEYVAANEILNQLATTEPALGLPSTFNVEVIFTSLLILAIAQIWGYGLELERDLELTI